MSPTILSALTARCDALGCDALLLCMRWAGRYEAAERLEVTTDGQLWLGPHCLTPITRAVADVRFGADNVARALATGEMVWVGAPVVEVSHG